MSALTKRIRTGFENPSISDRSSLPFAAEVDAPSEFREIYQDLKPEFLEVPELGENAMALAPDARSMPISFTI